jgi:hypothetical protein
VYVGVSFHETPDLFLASGPGFRGQAQELNTASCRNRSNSPECEAFKEERRDSNPRPPGPQPGALTGCATLPMFLCTPGRIRTSGQRLRRPLLCPLSYGRMRAVNKSLGLADARTSSVGTAVAETHACPRFALSPLRILPGYAVSVCVGRWVMSIAVFQAVRVPTHRPEGPLERETGIEPASLAWKARALPLSYSRTESERPDSNRRPQRPERCALTKLRHSPFGCRFRYSIITKLRLPSRRMVRVICASSSSEITAFQPSTDSIG